MPRFADHSERRTAIADALINVIAQRGIEAVSIRSIAAEAGVSAGTVQHYFSSKQEIFDFAVASLRVRASARIAEHLEVQASSPGASPGRQVARTVLKQVLPLDDASLRESKVALALHAHAVTHGGASSAQVADWEELRRFVVEEIHVGSDLLFADRMAMATALMGAAEGLSILALAGYVSKSEAAEAFDLLDRMLGN